MRAMILTAMDNYHKKFSWWAATVALKYVAIALAVIAWSLIMVRVGEAKSAAKYEAWKERFADEYIRQMEAAERKYPPDPKEEYLNSQSESLARVLYGVKDNSTADLKTYCWCVFNRVDNPAYPNTMEEVIAQPKQWMRYSEDNPVLDNLYQIAREQIQLWQNGRRPVSNEFIYMSWTAARIVLRDTWQYGMNTNTWVWSGDA